MTADSVRLLLESLRDRLGRVLPLALSTLAACGGGVSAGAESEGGTSDATTHADSSSMRVEPGDAAADSPHRPVVADSGAITHDSGKDMGMPLDAAGSSEAAPGCGGLNANCIQGSDCCSRVCGPTGLCTPPSGADAGPVCGQVTCNPGQICVYPCCFTEMGACGAPCTIAGGNCVPPAPSCVDVTAACRAGTDCSCFQGPSLCNSEFVLGCPIEGGTVACGC